MISKRNKNLVLLGCLLNMKGAQFSAEQLDEKISEDVQFALKHNCLLVRKCATQPFTFKFCFR